MSAKPKQVIVGGSLSDDYTSDWFPARGYEAVAIQLEIDGTGSPVGSFYFQGREHPSAEAFDIPLNGVAGAGVTHTAGEAEIAYDNSSTDGRIAVTLTEPPRHWRVRFVHGSGAGATALNGYATSRKHAEG